MTIVKDNFNRDLDDYIHKTKNKGKSKGFELKFNFSNDKPKSKIYTDESQGSGSVFDIFSKKPKKDQELVKVKKEIEKTGEQIEELKEEEEVLEEKRESLISRMFNSIFSPKQKELPDQVEVVDIPKEEPKPAISQDVVEVMKIAGRWLNRLDPETKQEFRDSADFAKYKYLVDKINKK